MTVQRCGSDQSASIIIGPAEGATGDWSNLTPANDGKVGKCKTLAKQLSASGWLGVENHEVYFVQLHHFHHFPTLIGAHQHAQGCTRAENG